MSHGRFTKGYLDPAGKVTVTGPFDPDDAEVVFARIIFLVVQAQGGAQDTVVVRGEGAWRRGAGGAITGWRGTAPRNGDLALGPSTNVLQADDGKKTRGIALSVVVQPGHVQNGDFDPPSIEALNWCTNLEIVTGPPPPP